MPASDLTLLIDAALIAGDIALRHWGGSPQTWTKDDDSPVSAADLEVDRALRDALGAARPAYGWLSEESPDDPARLEREHCFILDPIDGTRAFLKGEKTWAVSLAVAQGSGIAAGVVHMPATGRTYTAAAGQGAWLNGVPLSVSDRAEPDGARLLASRPVYAEKNWRRLPVFERMFRPSLAYRIACVAEGRADAVLTLRPSWEWDIAAGALIAAEAGARVTDRHGAPLRFNSPTRRSPGLLAANAGLHGAIGQALA